MTDRPRRQWRVASHVALYVCGCVVILIVAGPMAGVFAPQWRPLVIGVITSVATFALTIAFVAWDEICLADVGAAFRRGSIARMIAGLACGLLLIALQTLLMAVSTNHVRWVHGASPGASAILTAVLAFFALACREELALRGYPLRRLDSVWGRWIALLLIAVVFALEHVAGGARWLPAFLGSGVGALVFGLAALVTRGLAFPIGLHAAWNIGDWIRGGKESPGLWHIVVDDGFAAHAERVGFASYLIVMTAAVFVLLWFLRKQIVPSCRLDASSNGCRQPPSRRRWELPRRQF